MTDSPLEDQTPTPDEPTPDELSPGEPAQTTPADAKPKRERRPKYFGERGWLIVLAPMIIFLVGVNVISYLETARAHAALKEQMKVMSDAINNFNATQTPAERQEDSLNLNGFRDVMLSGEDPEPDQLRKVAQEILDPKPTNDTPERAKLRMETEFLIDLTSWYEEGRSQKVLTEAHQHRLARDPEPPPPGDEDADQLTQGTGGSKWFPDGRSWYPSLYTIVIAATTLWMLCVIPGYLKVPFRVSWLAVVMGVVGFLLWIGIWWLDKNVFHLASMLGKGAREAFDPFSELGDDRQWMYTFLAIRFFGLVVVVPIVEEFFLRGWLMRYIDDPDWDELPLGVLTKLNAIGIAIYGAFTHPAEPIAAVIWFSMGTWLFSRTKNIWDCVVYHMVTNLLLGLFVLRYEVWELW